MIPSYTPYAKISIKDNRLIIIPYDEPPTPGMYTYRDVHIQRPYGSPNIINIEADYMVACIDLFDDLTLDERNKIAMDTMEWNKSIIDDVNFTSWGFRWIFGNSIKPVIRHRTFYYTGKIQKYNKSFYNMPTEIIL